MKTLELTQDELIAVSATVNRVKQRFNSTENQAFLDEAALFAHELPYRLRKFLHGFRVGLISDGLCKVSGFLIDDAKIGMTPSDWCHEMDSVSSLEERIFHGLCASLLGEVFGWSTQQNGRITHDVFPIRKYEDEQLGFSSREPLTWHTEDAFHDYRPDFLALMCLRNPDRVGTHCGKPDYSKLSEEQISYLFAPHFTIKPDNSHLAVNNVLEEKDGGGLAPSFADIERMKTAPKKLSVLFGSRAMPYLRIDPYFMEPVQDPKADEALRALIRSIDEDYREYPIEPGDIVFIHNLMVVHGRKSFSARYDGTDRWLKRLLISRDLGKSRDRRAEEFSRIIM